MRKYYLTTCLIAVLALNACADKSSDGAIELATPETHAASVLETDPNLKERTPAQTPASDPIETPDDGAQTSSLPSHLQGFDPQDISAAELEELNALQEKQSEARHERSQQMRDWRDQDPSTRGPRPVSNITPLSPEDTERLQALNEKFQIASIRKQYENVDSSILSKAEIQEIIALEQARLRAAFEHRKKIDFGTDFSSFYVPDPSPRLAELQGKIQSAERVERLNNRIERLGTAHNISFSDSEIGELISLEQESQKLQQEFNPIMTQLEQNRIANGEGYSEIDAINAIPKPVLKRMMQIEQRKEAIKAPLEAAERAERITNQLTGLSAESGVPLLSGELAETIALNAEKDRIGSKAESDAILKWMNEGGPLPHGEPLPNDADYARLKEIDARLKAISAPMTEAKNAALEADNPLLRQQRLQQEAQQKWATDWQDKKQAGEIPLDTPISYPTYSQMEDSVKDYRTKLKTRANKVGYTVSDADIERLEALNAQKLSIRKQVYDMEVDGSWRVENGKNRNRAPAFGKEARMYKVRLIEEQQRKILAGLTGNETGDFSSAVGGKNGTEGQSFTSKQAGFIIHMAKESGQDISQAEIDDLLAFEQSMTGE